MNLEALAEAAHRAAASIAQLVDPVEAACDLALELASNQSRRRFHHPDHTIDTTPFPLLAGDIPDDYEAPR